MTVEEIFSRIASHMIKGLMFHSQMAEYYMFLGLEGYSQCHEYHYLCETKSYHKIVTEYIRCYNKLLPQNRADDPGVIPSSWYKYVRTDVDVNTKKNAVKTGIEKWVAWEKETKQLYEQMYHELVKLSEVAAADQVLCLIEDVTDELKTVECYHLNKKATDYDMVYVIEEQDKRKDEFEREYRSLFLK